MAIQSFAQFQPEYERLQEAKSFSATEWEQLIVIAFNGGWPKKGEKRDTFGIAQADYRAVESIAKKIADDIKQTTGAARAEMLHFGTGAGETVKMIDWWQGKNTPKTDCYTTSGVRVSLKKEGGSQLISGLKSETLSTFKAATKYLNQSESASEELLTRIDTALSRRISSGQFNINTIAKVADDIEKYRKLSAAEKEQFAAAGITSEKDLRNWIEDVITFKTGKTHEVSSVDRETIFDTAKKMVNIRNEFKNITPLIREWFEDNPAFKLWFTYEAASGHMKFAPTPKASANWIVEFNTTGGHNQVNRLEKASSTAGRVIPSSYMEELSHKTTFRIGFKTATGSGKGGSAAASLRSGEKTKKQLAKERETLNAGVAPLSELEYFAESAWLDIVESSLLTEGIMDSLKSAFSSVTRALTEWVKRIMTKLREIASKGIDALLSFLGIEVETVDVDGIDMLFAE